MEECKEMLNAIMKQLNHIESKINDVALRVNSYTGGRSNNSSAISQEEQGIMKKLTTKNHAVLQMLFEGKSNGEIADFFGVSVNSSKVYLKTIGKTFGVATRTQIAIAGKQIMDKMTDEEYRFYSGGLPIDWYKQVMETGRNDYEHLMESRSSG